MRAVTKAAVMATGLAVAGGLVHTGEGAPVVTGSQVRAFLGGNTGRLVYTYLESDAVNKCGNALRYLDFSEETLTEHEIMNTRSESTTTEPRNALIAPDGNWVVYNTIMRDACWDSRPNYWSPQVYISRLQANASNRVSLGEGGLPHWWQKPGTDEQYIIYNGRDLDNDGWVGNYNGGFPPTVSPTYCQQINPTTKATIGSRTTLIPYQANGGRSVNGQWLFTAGGIPGTFRIDATVTSNATIHEQLDISLYDWDDQDDLDGCNPSISPHWSETDLRVLYLDKPHTGYHVCDVRGGNRTHTDWTTESTNRYIDETEWSTHPDYATVKASVNNQEAPFDIYIIRLTDHARLRVIDGNASFPHLWVEYTIGVEPRSMTPAEGRGKPGAATLARWAASPAAAPSGTSVHDMRGRAVAGAKAASGVYLVRAGAFTSTGVASR